jgi:hypothetical protein
MRRYYKLSPLIFVLPLMGCPPASGPGPNPPSVTWTVLNTNANSTQNFGQNGTVHVGGSTTYTLSFAAVAPGGLKTITLQAQGNPACAANNGTGGVYTAGNQSVSLPPQSTNFNPVVNSNTLLITGFVFYQFDCNVMVPVSNTPPVSKEAYAVSGIIVLTGTATDTSNRTTTGQLQVQVP